MKANFDLRQDRILISVLMLISLYFNCSFKIVKLYLTN